MKRYLVFVTVVVLTVVAPGLLLAQSNTQVGSSPASTSDAGFAQEILKAIGIDAPPLVIAKARAPPHQESFPLPVDDGIDPVYPD